MDLEFLDWRKKIEENLLIKDGWIVLYANDTYFKDNSDQGAFFCALVKNYKKNEILNNYSWDITIRDYRPYFEEKYENEKRTIIYKNYPYKNIEIFLRKRDFYGIKKASWEISEEFRLYFNLYHDQEKNIFIYIDDNGDFEEVIKIQDDCILGNIKFIKTFLSAKNMSLIVFFDLMRFQKKENLNFINKDIKGNNFCYNIYVGNSDNKRDQGWLMGKFLISGFKKFIPDISTNLQKIDLVYESFIIGKDENGDDILSTCAEENLNNFHKNNKIGADYLSFVFFNKKVLDKYYNEPEKYSVSDGYIFCKNLWSLRLDNSNTDNIVVFLGDLGKLPYKEQKHWKSFNIFSSGVSVSETFYNRMFLGKCCEPYIPDLFFKNKFNTFQEKWKDRFHWYLFKPLSNEDSHLFQSLHSLSENSQKTFEEQILFLTKIIIDSLNAKELEKKIEIFEKHDGSITKLEKFLQYYRFNSSEMILFLKNLQKLRSNFSAHRKNPDDKDYKKIQQYFCLEKKAYKDSFDEILVKTIMIFNTLENFFNLKKDSF